MSSAESDTKLDALESLMIEINPKDQKKSHQTNLLVSSKNSPSYGLLGSIENSPVYLNTNEPFCLVTFGVQGAGKSHSVSTVLENCLLDCPQMIKAHPPVKAVVFHFDQDPENSCEAISLTRLNTSLSSLKNGELPVAKKICVLVSPSYYRQRKQFYEGTPNCTVQPLLFNWADLTASQLKSLMRVDTSEMMPLYMSSLLEVLRKIQKSNLVKSFTQFKADLKELCFTGKQTSPLELRLRLLESMVIESDENYMHRGLITLSKIFEDPETLVVVDLTDPMLSPDEANGIFQVLLSKFLATKLNVGKLILFDEAHKYMGIGSTDELGYQIVTSIRQMRHHGLRIIISTQSPTSVNEEIIDLASMVMIHQLHSIQWFNYLKSRIPLSDDDYSKIITLETGSALVFYSRWDFKEFPLSIEESIGRGGFFREIKVRLRLTSDGGVSKTHVL